MKITFLRGLYDSDGDEIDDGIYLHFDDKFYLKVKDESELEEMSKTLQSIIKEIKG